MNQINDILAKQPILIFDGECGFCNKSVLFFIQREKNKKMHFVSQHSQTGKDLLNYFELDPGIDSIVLIRDYSAYIKSCAVLRLTWYMKGAWPLLSFFLIIPPFIRNRFYEFVARRRMIIAGRVESCALLSEEDLKRIL